MLLMLRKVTFKNFYSFKDEQVLDFTTNKKKGDNYFTASDGKQISKVFAFAGPNNSGKTNLMKVFGFIDFFLSVPHRSFTDGFDLVFKPYVFCTEEPSSFSIEFETEHKLYSYTLEATKNEVLKEVLEAKKLEKGSRKYEVFSRTRDSIVLNKKVVQGVTAKSLSTIRGDVSVVAFLKASYDIGEINEISNYLQRFRTNIDEEGTVPTPEERIDYTADKYSRFPKLKESMEEFIRDFDLGIDGFTIKKNEDSHVVSARHTVNGKKYELPINYESRGTKSLFVELLYILNSISSGSVLALDEIESGLHPQAVDKLIQHIVDSFSDSKKQFIFSSHSLNYMKKLDPQQMFLVEKNENMSQVFRLDTLDIRTDENFYAKYMSGSYGAFPKIRV